VFPLPRESTPVSNGRRSRGNFTVDTSSKQVLAAGATDVFSPNQKMLAPRIEPRAAENVSQTSSLQESTAVLTRIAQTQWEEIVTICSLAKSNFVDDDFSPSARSQFGAEGKAKGYVFSQQHTADTELMKSTHSFHTVYPHSTYRMAQTKHLQSTHAAALTQPIQH
jgi:hypothetical protein